MENHRLFKPAAVIFDMDGLMLDTERVASAACQRAAASMGCEMTDELYLRTVGRNESDTRLIFMEHYGSKFAYDAFREQWNQNRANIEEIEGIGIKPGLLELLEHLHRHQTPVAVATSTARAKADALLQSTKLLHRFDAVVGGDEIKKGKPAPDIFLKAANLLDVHPADCLVLEDSEPGVMAAHAAGMRAIIVPDLKPPSGKLAELSWIICASLHEVRQVLAQEC